MVSRTRVTKTRRVNKLGKQGLKRKKRNKNHGTTPKFPIHLDKKEDKKAE